VGSTLKTKFLLVFVGVMAVNVAGALLLFQTIASQRADAVVINLAGAQRMLSQKMTKEAAMGDGKAASVSIARFDRVLNGLVQGDSELGLPRSQDPAILSQLARVASLWSAYRPVLEARLKSNHENASRNASALAANVAILQEMDAAVKLFEVRSSAKVERTKWIQSAVLAVVIGTLGLTWVILIAPLLRRLSVIVTTVSEGAGQTASASVAISSASQTLAQSVSEQAAALHQTSESSSQISVMAQRNQNSSEAASVQVVEAGLRIDEANDGLKEMLAAIDRSREAADKISKVIRVIDEVAFQTNVLALNAAIEAARAGQAGQGFSVVADEVRHLAQRSAQAARETADLIQGSILTAAEAQSSVARVAGLIDSLTQSSASIGSLVKEVTNGSQQQAHGIKTIADAVSQMEQMTQSTAASAEESAAASQELSAQSEILRETAADLAALLGVITLRNGGSRELAGSSKIRPFFAHSSSEF
jgi:methyl-accepting chemotaxis protein